jgi:hypothetical protein
MKQGTNFHPIVPRHWLFVISGILWCAVGALMCLRAYFWTYHTSIDHFLTVEIVGIITALIGFRFVFSKITRRNIDRIKTLPERSSFFSFTGTRGYIMIISMISLGIFLRNSPIPKEYLAIPYNAMGGSLIFGGLNFLSVFRNHYKKNRIIES